MEGDLVGSGAFRAGGVSFNEGAADAAAST
jgi:hypothetical protein